MRLTVRLLMRIYQGASLSWHWSAGVLATVVFGNCCAVKGFMLIISACSDADYDVRLVQDCCYDPDRDAHEALLRSGFGGRVQVV
ncbi:Uncharacterised protein [Klebsiella pneumoniae]|nr:Uncharacterised protein [Klebsiella pneumoniae]